VPVVVPGRQRAAKAEAFEKAQAARDPLAVAEALGWPGDDLEGLAHALYKMSKSANPADRASAQQMLKQRQAMSETEALKKQLEELKGSLEKQRVEAQQQAFVQEYAGRLTAATSDDHPLVRNAVKNAGKEAQHEMLILAARLEQKTGQTPDPADVVQAYEQALRRQAMALGFDPSQLGKQEPVTKTPTLEGQKTPKAKTLTNDLGTQTRPRAAPASLDESFEETVREIEEMERASKRAK